MKLEEPLPDMSDDMDKPPASVANAQQRSTSVPQSSRSPSAHFPRPVHVEFLSTQPASPAFSTPARNPHVHLVDLLHSPLAVVSPLARAPPPALKPAPARAPAPVRREESDSDSSDVVITGMQLQNRRHRSRERRTRDLRRAQAQMGRSPSGSRERDEQ